MLAELTPTPDQVTIAINTNQMNVVEQMTEADVAGRSLSEPVNYRAHREMTIPAGPEWVEEHIKRLSAKPMAARPASMNAQADGSESDLLSPPRSPLCAEGIHACESPGDTPI